MRVITIEEDSHGMIGIAKTYADAVHFLVNDSWLSALTEIYCGDEIFKTVIEDLGEDWLAVILDWSMEKFCEYFEGYFYLNSVEVYEVAQSTSLIGGRRSVKGAGIFVNWQFQQKCRQILCILPIAFFSRKWYYNYRKRGKQNVKKEKLEKLLDKN